MKRYLKTLDFAVSGESFDLQYNEDLNMLETKPRPGDLAPYYDSPTYISHTDASGGLLNTLYKTVKRRSLARKVRLIRKYQNPPGPLLDMGAGTGDFVGAALAAGWDAQGVEPNAGARARARAKGIFLEESPEPLKGEFAIITLWHVLEHLPELDQAIDQLCAILKQEGSLILALPNFKSWDARHYGLHWAGYDVPRHLWHFSRDSIKTIFENRGFRIVKTCPLLFDAFYVSLLSEKYKGSRWPWLRAFVAGCRSNVSAMRTGEYSSLIYVLESRKGK